MITDHATNAASTTAEKMELETTKPMLISGLLHEPWPGIGFHWYETRSHCFHSQTDTAIMNTSNKVQRIHGHHRERRHVVPALSRLIKAAEANLGMLKLKMMVEIKTRFQ